MNAGQLAALIAAGAFAVLAGAVVYLLIRLARLVSVASDAVAQWQGRSGELLASAQAAVDRTSEQLARTDAITGSMDQVTLSMTELSGHVSALAGLAGGISGALETPLLRLAAAGYGVRRAVALRRPARAAVTAAQRPRQRARQ